MNTLETNHKNHLQAIFSTLLAVAVALPVADQTAEETHIAVVQVEAAESDHKANQKRGVSHEASFEISSYGKFLAPKLQK